jgi:hypothetical protein
MAEDLDQMSAPARPSADSLPSVTTDVLEIRASAVSGGRA